MRTYRFYQIFHGKWFIDLPEWEGDKDDLEMVAGADRMLERIAGGKSELHLTIATKNFEGADKLVLLRVDEGEGGGYYFLEKYRGRYVMMELWLCYVTRFVFGEMPKELFIAKV